jgi:type IV secretory pathway TrbL component
VVLLLVVALAVVVPLGVVILVGGGVELLPLGAVGDEVGGITALQPLGDLLLSLRNMCRAQNFLASKVISSSEMLSYCSSEAAAKEDKTNSKADEIVVLVGLASWPPTRALVIKALLVREAS